MVEPSIGYGLRLNKDIEKLIAKVLRVADSLIAVSPPIYKEAIKLVRGKEARKFHYIPNAVDIERFNPYLNGKKIRETLGLKNDHYIVLSVRHLSKNEFVISF